MIPYYARNNRGEDSLYIGQPLDNVYIHSKFEAESAVFDAMLTGLDAKIILVGNLTSREFGLFPDYLMPLFSKFSP